MCVKDEAMGLTRSVLVGGGEIVIASPSENRVSIGFVADATGVYITDGKSITSTSSFFLGVNNGIIEFVGELATHEWRAISIAGNITVGIVEYVRDPAKQRK